MLQALFKALEGSTFPVRRAVSSTLSAILAFTQLKATTDPNKPAVKRISTAITTDVSTPEDLASKETTLLSMEQMLLQLSTAYNRLTAPKELKAGIIETYAALFIQLGTRFVESNYAAIVKHLFTELLGNLRNVINQSDAAFIREEVFFLLNDVIGRRLLSEQGQASAVDVLINEWIKAWPALMPNQVAPNKQALITAVNLVSSLVSELGGAVLPVEPILISPLITLLSYPSSAVQAASAWCLRCVCTALPTNLGAVLPTLFGLLEKDLNNLSNASAKTELFRRTIGHVHAVASVMSVFPSRPIYTSFDWSQRASSLAKQLLDRTHKDPAIASVQIQVAWTLISALMGLGPSIVKLHLTQLLLMWKNALPKPTGKESNSIRNEAEWSFILHQKECVITSILSFLKHNSKSLVTLEIAKRISALLSNTLAFLTTAPLDYAPTTLSPCMPFETKLTDQNYLLRKRIFECFIAIKPSSIYESLFSSLLRNSVSVFASPEKIIPSSGAQVHVTAAVPGQYVSIWNSSDGHGFGVTSKLAGYSANVAALATAHEQDENRSKDWMAKDRYRKIEQQLEQPIMGSLELDSLYIYSTLQPNRRSTPRPVSPSTSYIDASVELFATLFPFQSPPVQESILEQILKLMKEQKGDKNSPKKMAVLVNVVVALLGAFRNTTTGGKKGEGAKATIASGRTAQICQEILQEAIVHPDPYLRNAAGDALGRLVNVIGGSLMSSQIQYLVDLVVNNRDPDARAGCSLALGYIYSHVGGMAAGNHLKTIVGILLSLSSDPHPVVHCWALESLTMTISAASLMFSGYVSSTLGLVAKLYLVETHEPGGGSTAVSNAGMAIGFTAYQEFGRIIYELVGTLGPELQAMSKVRELCMNIVEELKLEPDERVNMEAIRCTQQFIMFAQSYVDLNLLVPYLQVQLSSFHLPLKKAAVTCLYQLVQRNAEAVFKTATPGLDTELFSMLDTEPSLTDVKDVIRSWLKETAVKQPSVWVNITKQVLSGAVTSASISKDAETRKSVDEVNIADNFDDDFDDEGAEDFNDEDGNADITTTVADSSLGPQTSIIANVDIPPRWRTQLFSLLCLQECIELVSAYGGREHFDLISARRKRQQAGVGDFLVFRVGDLIKLSFTAATAPVNELRLVGINLLRTVIEVNNLSDYRLLFVFLKINTISFVSLGRNLQTLLILTWKELSC